MSQAKSIYICENCGKTVLPENYYGSSRFCYRKCSITYVSKNFSNNENQYRKNQGSVSINH